jgi:hypothetical protein
MVLPHDAPHGVGTREWYLFQHTGGLVDVFDPSTKIIFVLPTDVMQGVSFGEMDFEVGVAGQRGQNLRRAPIYDADPLITWMIDRVCSSRTSLKEVMGKYTEGRILNGLDWVFIDSLVGTLTARYPPRPEETRGMVGADGRMMNGWWAPAQVLEAYNNDNPLAPGYVQGNSDFFCHLAAVSAFDHTFLARTRSRRYPAIQLGAWTNADELIIMLGFGIYDAYTPGDQEACKQRLYSTGADRIERTAFLRRAVEEWKVSRGNIGDLVVCPTGVSDRSQRWLTYVQGGKVVGLKTIAETALGGNTVRWSWDGNRMRQTVVSFTGIRTPPAMWVNNMNIMPTPQLEATERYSRATTPGLWYTNQFIQKGQGHQDMVMQRLTSRLNWRQVRGRVSAMGWPQQLENTKLCYNLESFSQVGLFQRTGWGQGIPAIEGGDRMYVWGWGGGLASRDWADMSYRVTTFQSSLFEKMMRGGCDLDLVYTPVQLVAPFQTTEDEFIFGEEGASESDFRAGASKRPEPPGSTGADIGSGEVTNGGVAEAGKLGEDGKKKSADDGKKKELMVVPPGAGTTTEVPGATTTVAAVGSDKTADTTGGSEDLSKKRKKKDEEAVKPNPGIVAKVGSDAASASLNIDHRKPAGDT